MPDAAARPHHLTCTTPVGGQARVECNDCHAHAHGSSIEAATRIVAAFPCPGMPLDRVADAVEVDPHEWPRDTLNTWQRRGH